MVHFVYEDHRLEYFGQLFAVVLDTLVEQFAVEVNDPVGGNSIELRLYFHLGRVCELAVRTVQASQQIAARQKYSVDHPNMIIIKLTNRYKRNARMIFYGIAEFILVN